MNSIFFHSRRVMVILAVFAAWTGGLASGADNAAVSAEKEKELIAVLRSDAPPSEKAIACKLLSVHGSSAAVPELAKLLNNEQLASWSRIALEAIPGSASDESLRSAIDSLNGNLLVGVINSIGVRRDARAVEPLAARLQDKNVDVASAAAVALGHIGDAAATKVLRASLMTAAAEVRSAVAEGCVLCAERCLAEGRDAEAAEIYDEVRKAEIPKQRVLEATRGAILARGKQGIPLLVEQLSSEDAGLFGIALSTTREIPGREVDEALAEMLTRSKPERSALILVAMADRKDTVMLPAVVQAAIRGPQAVRLSAIRALGRVGDASCVSPLLEIAVENDAVLSSAAKTALAELPGESVDNEIAARLVQPDGKIYPLLLELVGHRRMEAIPALIKASGNADPTVRSAAFLALGATVPAKNLPVLVSQVISPKYAQDSEVARRALKTACVRMPDRESCAAELASALDRAPAATKTVLLEILGDVGGVKALQTLAAAAKGNDPQLQDTSTRLLGEWMTIDAAPVLLDLAKTAPGEKYKVRALRGYIRIARQFVIPDAQRAEMCQLAFDASDNLAERKLVVDVLKRYAAIEMLALAVKATQIPELKDDATQVALAIAKKSGDKGLDIQELISRIGLDRVKVEIIKAEYGAGSTQIDVTEILKRHVTDLPLITLSSPTYNASFGGDPTPGTAKQLKIRYKINGKAGEASFPENSAIILNLPKP